MMVTRRRMMMLRERKTASKVTGLLNAGWRRNSGRRGWMDGYDDTTVTVE
jgi:hypothetical protein